MADRIDREEDARRTRPDARASDERELRGPAEDEDAVQVTKGLGGATGAAAGAGLGAILGPAGVVVGGLAGALGGWWAGGAVSENVGDFDDETDEYYRRLHEQQYAQTCSYDDARGYYRLGELAGRNPDYRGRSFAEVEPELRRGWDAGRDPRFRDWDAVRPFVSEGYGARR